MPEHPPRPGAKSTTPVDDARDAREARLDEELEETFPASDPTGVASVLPVADRRDA